jgi:hypothetical protein
MYSSNEEMIPLNDKLYLNIYIYIYIYIYEIYVQFWEPKLPLGQKDLRTQIRVVK